MQREDPVPIRDFDPDLFRKVELLETLVEARPVGRIGLQDEVLRTGMDKEEEPDLSLAIEEAVHSTLSGKKSFDIMGHQIVQEFDSVRAPNRKERSWEFLEKANRSSYRFDLGRHVVNHDVDYTNKVPGTG